MATTTKMIEACPVSTEFVDKMDDEDVDEVTGPPWYVVRVSGGCWKGSEWYSWQGYQGPPQVFLTKKKAEKEAASKRKQYKCTTKVVPIIPEDWVCDEIT